MTDLADAVMTIELFNAKAEELLASTFFDQVSGGGAIVQFSRESGWDGVHVGTDEESTRALVLTLRLFMQDNDRISLRSTASLYDSIPLSAGVKNEFKDRRDSLNAFLDSASPLAISEDRPLSYREILCVFVYGQYAHVDRKHRQTFEALRTTAFVPIFQDCLLQAIVALTRCVAAVRQVNEAALSELAPVRDDGP